MIPEVDKKEETSVDKEPEKDETASPDEQKDMQNDNNGGENNAQSCNTKDETAMMNKLLQVLNPKRLNKM